MNVQHGLPLSIKNKVKLPHSLSCIGEGVSLSSPASSVFTDFTKTRALTVRARTQIDAALEQMIQIGVRLLFVMDQTGSLLGLVTADDIMGEKPMVYLQSHDGQYNALTRAHILVQDIMQTPEEWKVINFEDIAHAVVGDIVRNFREIGQRHLVVIEYENESKTPIIKGLFSATKLENMLNIKLPATVEPFQSFAEIERVLVG